jgi:alkylation response protein AidB-like acyl-CoA dehydrogenase
LAHGTKELNDRVSRACITGEKIIALAITEPTAGSDVSRIRTTAESLDNDHFVLNGEKKFITSGCRADYFTVACRTVDGDGRRGISLLMVESNLPGVSVRRIPTTGIAFVIMCVSMYLLFEYFATVGWWASNTAFIAFNDVKVSKRNLIGELNQGFLYIMLNFNRERFGVSIFLCFCCEI